MTSRENIIKTNELFGLFNKKFEFDKRAKETFSDMLKHIKDLDVRVVGDSKRDVVFGGKKQKLNPKNLIKKNQLKLMLIKRNPRINLRLRNQMKFQKSFQFLRNM